MGCPYAGFGESKFTEMHSSHARVVRFPTPKSAKLPAMKIIRFQDPNGSIGFAARKADNDWVIRGDVFTGYAVTNQPANVATLLAPIAPVQLLCIGLNYRRHAEETGAAVPAHPILFLKNIASVQHPNGPIVLPRHLRSDEVDYECELAVVIGHGPNGAICRNVSRENALEHVLGYTCANDVSARDWQKRGGGGQWCRGKSFDTFAPLGPCLVTRDEIPDPQTLRIQTILNGESVQDWNTSDMIFPVAQIIEFLSASTTLPPGTVILTGTPQGVGMARNPPLFLREGDVVTIEIEGIGALTNPVVAEEIG